MRSILKLFSEHGTFIQPDALDYISNKENPDDFASFLLKNLKEYPLFLTVVNIKNVEESSKEEKPSTPDDAVLETKELQNKVLSEIYNKTILVDEISDEESDDFEEEDMSELENREEPLQTIEIKTVKGWKPLSKEYESEVKILKDVTGESTCEGTTQDFVKLFRNRHDVLRKIIRSQRREMVHVIPIGRINKTFQMFNL